MISSGAMLGKPKMLGAALYFAYSYLGSETGYPFTNFIVINNNDEDTQRRRAEGNLLVARRRRRELRWTKLKIFGNVL